MSKPWLTVKASLTLAALALLVGACSSTSTQGTSADESGDDDDDSAETKPSSDDDPEADACVPGDPSDLERVQAAAQIGNVGTAQRVEVGQEVYGVLKPLPYSDGYDLAYFIITVDEPTWVTVTFSSSDSVTLGAYHDGECGAETPAECSGLNFAAKKDKPVSKPLKLWPGDTRITLDARAPVKEAFYDLGIATGCAPAGE